MKYITLLLFYAGFSSMVTAQFNTYVDLVPFVTDCDVERTLDEAVICSEARLIGYFLADIDTTFCPTTDTTRSVRVSIDVDNKGAYSTKVVSTRMRKSCLDYLQQKALAMPEQIELFPAELDGRPTSFIKRVSFTYPEPQITPEVADSLAGDTVYKILEEMPRFYNQQCEEMLGGPEDKGSCAANSMLRFIYSSLRYPAAARENGVEGFVVSQFVVNKEGYVEDVQIKSDIGGGCGEAVLKIIGLMNEQRYPPFVPGQQFGKPVKVMYTMPVRFKLEHSPRKRKKKKK